MRIVLSLVALLVVVAVVLQLATRQAPALKAVQGGATGAESLPAAAQRAADQINRVLEQGSAARAADAASQ